MVETATAAAVKPESSGSAQRVVGIGASAGGLEAMLELFARVQPDGKTAYVVAQHMGSLEHAELTARLLSNQCALPFSMARDNEVLRPDRGYLLPTGHDVTLEPSGRLHLPLTQGAYVSTPSVNRLFEQLALVYGERAIGVVMSGAGRDGESGARSLRMRGGQVLVQDPQTCKFVGMPSAVIEAKLADQVLRLQALAAVLAAPALRVEPEGTGSEVGVTVAQLYQVLEAVRSATGVDFSGYKDETLLRRLDQRMQTCQCPDFEAYWAYVQRNANELLVLRQRFLISYSSFLRDRDVFAAVEQDLRDMIRARGTEQPLRIWVVGCAGGEEAYTLALLMAEILRTQLPDGSIDRLKDCLQVVGTDLNPEAIDQAQRGVYRHRSVKAVPAQWLDRYFRRHGDDYQVIEAVRACCRFQCSDVQSQTPGPIFDWVSCRNVLIYFKPRLQARLLARFHEALTPDGRLLLAPSETPAVAEELFMPLSHIHKLFVKRQSASGIQALPRKVP